MGLSKYIAAGLLLMLASFGCRPKEAVAEQQLPAVDLSITWTDPEERAVCILKVEADSMYLYTAAGVWDKAYYSQKLDSIDRSIIYRAVKTAGSALRDTVVPCSEPAGWHYAIVNRGYAVEDAPAMSLQAFVDSVLAVSLIAPDFQYYFRDNSMSMRSNRDYYNEHNTWKNITMLWGLGAGLEPECGDKYVVTPTSITTTRGDDYSKFKILTNEERDSINRLVRKVNLDSRYNAYIVIMDLPNLGIKIDGKPVLYSCPNEFTGMDVYHELFHINSIAPVKLDKYR